VARILRSLTTDDGRVSTNQITVALPIHASGDLIVIGMSTDASGVTVTENTTTNWTAITSITSVDPSISTFYRFATSSAEADPVFDLSVTRYTSVSVVVIEGAATTGTIDATATGTQSSKAESTMPALTTINPDTLVLNFTASYGFYYLTMPRANVNALGMEANYSDITSFWYYGQNSGLQDTVAIDKKRDSATSSTAMVSIAINDSGGGLISGQCHTGTEPAETLSALAYPVNSNVTGLITGLDGFSATFENAVSSSSAFLKYSTVGTFALHQFNDTADMEGHGINLISSSNDLSDSLLSFSMASGGTEGVGDYANYGRYFGLINGADAGARLWKTEANDTALQVKYGAFPFIVDTNIAGTPSDFGTVDLTDVSKVTFQVTKTGYTYTAYAYLYKLGTMVMVYGSSSYPCSFADAARHSKTASLRTVQDSQGAQAEGQFYVTQDIQIGNGSNFTYWKSTSQSIEYPASWDEAEKKVHHRLVDSRLALTVKAASTDTIDLSSTTINFGGYHQFVIDAASHADASYLFSGLAIINSKVTLQDITGLTYSGIIFSGCKELTLNGADLSGGNTISNCVDAQAVTVTSAALFADLANCTFNNNAVAIKITGNQSGTWSDPNLTMSGNTYDIEYTGTTDFTIESAVTMTVNNSSSGTLTIVPTQALTITSNVTATIRYFDTGSQTVLASTSGVTLDYEFTDTDAIDIEVVAQGYLPFNVSNVTPYNGDYAVTLTSDPVYNASHGLALTTDYSYNRSTDVVTIVAEQEGRDIYSALQDLIRTNTSYYNTPFLMQAIGIDRIDFTGGMTIDSGDVQFWKGAGMQWYNAASAVNPVKKFCSIKSVGTIASGAECWFTQVDGAAPTQLTLSGSNKIDEVIQYYEDTNYDGTADYDYEGHLLFKTFANGYYQGRVDTLVAYGASALESYEYTVSLSNTANGLATGNPGISITLSDHTAAPIDPATSGDDFDFEIVDNGTNSISDIERQWNYDITLDPSATVYGFTAFDLPDFIAGDETQIGYVEGQDTTTTDHGCYVSRSSADHPDMTQFQSNDGSYYVVPVAPDYTGLDFTGLIAGSQVVIFETGTTTEIQRNNSSTTQETWSELYVSDQVVDYTIMKAGYNPIRVTGVTASNAVIGVAAQQSVARAYVASTGLTYTTNTTATVGTTTFTTNTATTVQNFYSHMVEEWIAQAHLANVEFPIVPNGGNSFSFDGGWEFDSGDIDFLSRDGMRYRDASNVLTATYAAILTSGTVTGLTAKIQQVEGLTPFNANSSGVVDQLIQVYGDLTHGNFDRTGYMMIKYQVNGYHQGVVDVLDVYGVSSLADELYIVPVEPTAITGFTTGDPALANPPTITIGSTVWQSLTYSITITDSAAGNTGEDIMRWINYSLSQLAEFEGFDPFNWSDMVYEYADIYKTLRGVLIQPAGGSLKINAAGDLLNINAGADNLTVAETGSTALMGIKVVKNDGTTIHDDFDALQADDGSVYTKPVTATAKVTNMPNDGVQRLQIYNVNTGEQYYNGDPAATIYSQNYTT